MTAITPVFLQAFRASGGRRRVAVLISAYFDESSEEDSQNGLFAVCGYAMNEAGLNKFVPAWKRMLDKYDLDFFRMSDCNSNSGEFEHLSEDECDKCARKAIKLARKYALQGYAYVIDQRDYRKILQADGFDCDSYSFLVWSSFIHVNKWVNQNKPDHKVALYFEAGYQSQPRATELLNAVLQDKFAGGIDNRVASASFAKKGDSEPLQAGDLIAWHVRKGYENGRKGKKIRKDTLALIENKSIKTIEFTPDLLRSIKAEFIKRAGSLANASRIIFSQRLEASV